MADPLTTAQLMELSSDILAEIDRLPSEIRSERLAFEIQGIMSVQNDIFTSEFLSQLDTLSRTVGNASEQDYDEMMYRSFGIKYAADHLQNLIRSDQWSKQIGLSPRLTKRTS